MSRGKFWMVHGESCSRPTVRHSSKQTAIQEAERLAKQIPGQEFAVLESLATVVKNDVSWEPHDADNNVEDIPF